MFNLFPGCFFKFTLKSEDKLAKDIFYGQEDIVNLSNVINEQ